MKKIFILSFLAAGLLCGCKGKSTASESDAGVGGPDNTIVLYYSQTGTTRAVAEEFGRQLGCPVEAIEAVDAYDGDYDATVSRWLEEKQGNTKVAVKPLDVNLDDYKVIFLGFPIWGGTYANPVATFINDNSLEGKKIVTFATFGSGGIDNATADLAAAQPGADVVRGYGVRTVRADQAPAEIARFLIENGFIAGEVEALPEYSPTFPVTETETDIFNQACGDYKFPLGTPVSYASRSTTSGTDYRFDVTSLTPDGNEAHSTIFVTVAQDAAPVFTEVIRN